jgi:hypothetical protein
MKRKERGLRSKRQEGRRNEIRRKPGNKRGLDKLKF